MEPTLLNLLHELISRLKADHAQTPTALKQESLEHLEAAYQLMTISNNFRILATDATTRRVRLEHPPILDPRIVAVARKNFARSTATNCEGCRNHHGQVHGGNLLVCGIHPYGWDGEERCPEFVVEHRSDPTPNPPIPSPISGFLDERRERDRDIDRSLQLKRDRDLLMLRYWVESILEWMNPTD